MKTAKEKAVELVDKFIPLTRKWDSENGWTDDESDSTDCALIAVEELINDCDASSPYEEQRIVYWQEVKEEIKLL